MKKKPFTIRLRADLSEWLSAEAEKRRHTQTRIIEDLLEAEIETQKNKKINN